MMSIDSRGVSRGRCTLCHCEEYHGGAAKLKCMRCGHPPGRHQNVNSQTNGLGQSTTSNTQQFGTGYSHSDSTHSHRHPITSYFYQTPVPTKQCSAPGCINPSFYDPSAGEFDYCSPECKDKDLLPTERQLLNKDLRAFENKIKAHIPTARKPGYISAPVQVALGQEQVPQKMVTGTVRNITPNLTNGSGSLKHNFTGKQRTFPVHFNKSPLKDLGLIISDEMFRCDTFSGLLVLGFEYDTKAEHLFRSGQIHLLDVITKLNGKDVSPFTYLDEIGKAAGSLVMDRSISLPAIQTLMDKVRMLKPSFIIVVMNPKNIPGCSTEKGFGFEVMKFKHNIIVGSESENTPARFSRLKFKDVILTYAFVKNDKLEVGKGDLTNVEVEKAASDEKTLILAVKRP